MSLSRGFEDFPGYFFEAAQAITFSCSAKDRAPSRRRFLVPHSRCLKFLEFLQILVRKIQNEDADNEPWKGRVYVVAVEYVFIDRVEYVPHPAPYEHQTERDGDVVPKVADEMLMGRIMIVVMSIHATKYTILAICSPCYYP